MLQTLSVPLSITYITYNLLRYFIWQTGSYSYSRNDKKPAFILLVGLTISTVGECLYVFNKYLIWKLLRVNRKSIDENMSIILKNNFKI